MLLNMGQGKTYELLQYAASNICKLEPHISVPHQNVSQPSHTFK